MYLTVLEQLFAMLLICVFGFFFARGNHFTERENNFVSRVMLYFVNPCLIINSFNKDFQIEKFKNLMLVIAISLFIHLVFSFISIILIRSKDSFGKTNLTAGLERVGIVFTNSGFIGIPLINGVFGSEGVFYLMGYLAVFNTYLWVFGVYQMSGGCNIKKIITNPNVISVLSGIILFCLPVKIPVLISRPMEYISQLNTALSMLLLGMLFATFKKTDGESYTKKVAFVTFYRLVLCAFVALGIVLCLWHCLPHTADIRQMLFIVFIASICPIGMSVSTFACVFGKDASFSSLMVSVSSALCVVSVPSFVRLAEFLMN